MWTPRPAVGSTPSSGASERDLQPTGLSPASAAQTGPGSELGTGMSVIDGKGRLRHDGGVVDSPGRYALRLPVLRRRRSTFLHGIEDGARFVVRHRAERLTPTAAA
ncbi:hypothetical protein [Actinoplanes sp. NPDC049802]|uniref:hypothetical protein n=1 Tax=Actinoplanes sp. NPDC049802 TaxID=3154742 RepID=UPI00340E4014